MLNRRARGLGSRPVSIRTQLPWYWRSSLVSVVAIAFLLCGYGMYELGRRLGGTYSEDGERERSELRTRVSSLEAELGQLRSLAFSSDSRLQVEKTAQSQLASQLKMVEEENARMKEELAFFENIVPGGKDDRLTIHRFRVEPNGVPGEYRYRMLVLAGAAREDREFNGSVQLVLNTQREERNTVITLPENRGASDPSFRLRFKRMHRVEGSFRIDPGVKIRSVQIRVLEQGSNQPRATENYTLS